MEFGLVAVWIVGFLLLGLAALPFAAWLLPDTEYAGFAIPIALTVVGVVGHLVGHVAFGWPALLAGVAALLGLSFVATSRTEVEIDVARAGEYALVFVVGFALVVVIRGIDPAAAPLPLSAGEKFLDFGLLSTLERSETLPPESMWFADEPVRYYYGGHLVASLLGTMTWTGPAYAYNLALAGFYATLVTAAFALSASIARPFAVSRRLAGTLGAFLVGIAGNLETAVRLVAWLLPDAGAEALVSSLGMDESVAAWSPGEFSYWDASRIVPVEPHNPESEFMAATEFPLFAWLNGDLHAHMMSQPFMLLAAGVLLASWRAPVSHRRLLLFGFLPPLAGLIGFVNLWSLPTVLGLTALAVAFGPENPTELFPARLHDWRDHPTRAREELSRLLLAPLVAAVVLLGALVWTAPFWPRVFGGPGQSVEYWPPWTPLGPLFVVFGGSLLVFAVYLARAVSTESEDVRISPTVLLSAGGFVIALTALLGWPALGLTLPLILVGWWLLRTGDVGFETLLVVAGAGVLLLVEFVTLSGERFNVIFKPYVHVWLFWAVATAVALPRLASGWPPIEGVDRDRLRQTGTVLAVAAVLLTAPYAGFAITDHVQTGTQTTDELGTTLDATAYLEVHYPEEAPAIRWLDSRAGQPTVLSAAPAGYYWVPEDGDGAAAPASLTGVPTVAGWTHEAQYRGSDSYDERVADVHAMYGGEPDEQRALLAEYGVEYVYVGPAEENSPHFEVTVGDLDAVTVAQSWDSVTVYEVDQEELAG